MVSWYLVASSVYCIGKKKCELNNNAFSLFVRWWTTEKWFWGFALEIDVLKYRES